jgi:acetoin utilization deacetylase AcuC-like enzyme
MGFCLYNNVAVAAAAARARGVERVAVVDIDVHHGNGTQWMFYTDPSVLYVSSHQFPFYPGTGAADEVGRGAGAGFTVNVPLEAGATDADYALVYRAIVGPVLEQFAPGLTIISAGYDAHDADPLASMRVSTAGFGRILTGLASGAARNGSALALVTEGGYELQALAACLDVTFQAVDTAIPAETPPALSEASDTARRGHRALSVVRAAHGPYWRL